MQAAPSTETEDAGEDIQATAGPELSFTTSNGTLDDLLKELGLNLDIDSDAGRQVLNNL